MIVLNKKIGRSTALALVTFILSFLNWAARAEPVAIVSDIAPGGGIVIQGGSERSAIAITTLIDANTRIQLAGAARLVVIYFNSGDEYTISGPGLIEFRVKEPVAVSGIAPVKRAPLGKVRIKSHGVALGAFVMRKAPVPMGIRLLNLERTRILESSPEFRWQGVEPGLRYQFELNDETGKALYEVQVEGVALKLPPTVALKEDTRYTWTVSTLLKDKRRYQRTGDFSIAAADLRASAEALRPPSEASVSERVTYAVWLHQMELRDEARGYWRALAAERPEDVRLKELAAE